MLFKVACFGIVNEGLPRGFVKRFSRSTRFLPQPKTNVSMTVFATGRVIVGVYRCVSGAESCFNESLAIGRKEWCW